MRKENSYFESKEIKTKNSKCNFDFNEIGIRIQEKKKIEILDVSQTRFSEYRAIH